VRGGQRATRDRTSAKRRARQRRSARYGALAQGGANRPQEVAAPGRNERGTHLGAGSGDAQSDSIKNE
jgi:hypothetical protein